MKAAQSVLLAVPILLWCQVVAALEIKLRVSRPDFLVGEPVTVEVILTNTSAQAVTLQADYRGLVQYEIGYEEEEMRRLKHEGMAWGGKFHGPSLTGYRVVLAPGQSTVVTERLLQDGSKIAAQRQLGRYWAFPEPGRYRLRALPTDKHQAVASPMVEVLIQPPPAADAVVAESLRQLDSYPSLLLKPEKMAEYARLLLQGAQEAARRKPESLEKYSRMLQSTSIVAQVRALVEQHPQSRYVGWMALSVARFERILQQDTTPLVTAMYERAIAQTTDRDVQAIAFEEWIRMQPRQKAWLLCRQALAQFPAGRWQARFQFLLDEYAPLSPSQQALWEFEAAGHTIVWDEALTRRYQQEVLGPVSAECKQKNLAGPACAQLLAQRYREWLQANMKPPTTDKTAPSSPFSAPTP